jgi:hypothetical protein
MNGAYEGFKIANTAANHNKRYWAKALNYCVLSPYPGMNAGAIIKSFNCRGNQRVVIPTCRERRSAETGVSRNVRKIDFDFDTDFD